MASFKDKPVINGLILACALLLAAIAAGPLNALSALAEGILAGLAAVVLGGIVLYFLYRNKRKVVPVSYDLNGRTLKITFGDRSSRRRVGRKLLLDDAERVWFRAGTILIRQKGFVYPITLPESSRSRFIEQMRINGWFDRLNLEPKARLVAGSSNLMLYVLIALVIVAALPAHPASQVTLSNAVVRKPLTAANVIAALNSQRSAFKLGSLQPDDALTAAAQSSCKDMTDHTYFGDLSTPQNADVYSKGIYINNWGNEVGAAVHSKNTPDEIAGHWVNSGLTGDTVLDKNDTLVGAAICRYTVNHNYDDIVVVELSS